MVNGARLLKAAIKKRKITRAAAARELKTSPAAVQYWIAGAQRPRADARERIEIWSGGDVPAGSWLLGSERDKLDAVRDDAREATGTDGAH